jgi:hypothetical protein
LRFFQSSRLPVEFGRRRFEQTPREVIGLTWDPIYDIAEIIPVALWRYRFRPIALSD